MPYADPPIGVLRWAPPEAPTTCKSTVTDAGRFGSICPQVRPVSGTAKMIGREDCLFINVWSPTLKADAKLPVMVWIHGGHLHTLSGGEEGYSPTEKLAADTGVVYVSFNYRLNALGFLALEILREGSSTNTSGLSEKTVHDVFNLLDIKSPPNKIEMDMQHNNNKNISYFLVSSSEQV